MDIFNQKYNELFEISKELLPYYEVDKIKPYSVYVWSKEECDDLGENLFDIESNKIVFYNNQHKIIEESLPIIARIQDKLKEIEELSKKKINNN